MRSLFSNHARQEGDPHSGGDQLKDEVDLTARAAIFGAILLLRQALRISSLSAKPSSNRMKGNPASFPF